MDAKAWAVSAALSLGLHAALGAAGYPLWPEADSPQDRSITISQLEILEEAPPVTPAPQPMRPIVEPPKAPAAATVPPARALAPKPSAFRVLTRTPAPPEPAQDVPLFARELARESAERLRDPKDGKVMTNYFGAVKDKIGQAVRRKQVSQDASGSVSLVFILNRQGELENAWVSARHSDADDQARQFALSCIKSAAPFPAFPRELDLPKIAFNLTLLFKD